MYCNHEKLRNEKTDKRKPDFKEKLFYTYQTYRTVNILEGDQQLARVYYANY